MWKIEMYVGVAGTGGDTGEWYTTHVDIPLSTPDNKVGQVATKRLEAALKAERADYVFVGVYSIPEPDDFEDEDDEEDATPEVKAKATKKTKAKTPVKKKKR